jgi:hypothetical protein
MSEPQYAEFIASSKLLSWQKEELLKAGDHNNLYQKMIFWHRLDGVKSAHADFHNYFISKGIFIQPELKERIRALSNMMYDAFRERELYEMVPVQGEHQFVKADRLQNEGLGELEAIEKDVQARLWEANKLD